MAIPKFVRVVSCVVSVSWALTFSPLDARAQESSIPSGEDGAEERAVLASQGEEVATDRFWLRGEYILWKVKRATVPALIGALPPEASELIRRFPDSTITPLFGGPAGIDYPLQSGGRLGTALWLGGDHEYGLEASYFRLAQGRHDFQGTSQGSQAFGPIFHDDTAGQEVLIMEAVPGLRAGDLAVDLSQHLWGAELNAFRRLPADGILDHVDLVAGFRHLQFSEGLLIRGTSRAIPEGRLPCG